MKRTINGLLLSVVSLVMFGCGGDCTSFIFHPTTTRSHTEPTVSVIMESFRSSGIESIALVPTQGVYVEDRLLIRATVQRDGALVPDGTPVTFTVPAGQGTLSNVVSVSPAKAVANSTSTTLTVPTAMGRAEVFIFRISSRITLESQQLRRARPTTVPVRSRLTVITMQG